MRINSIGTSIPQSLTSLDRAAELFGLSRRDRMIFSRYHGIESTSLFPDRSLQQNLEQACVGALGSWKGNAQDVQAILYCHSYHNNVPIDSIFLRNLADRLGCCNAHVLSLTMGACVSGFLGLHLATGGLPIQLGKAVLLLTGEKCFAQPCQIASNAAFFGESATCLVLGDQNQGFEILSLVTFVKGKYAQMLSAPSLELANSYDCEFLDTMQLVIEKALSQANLRPGNIAFLVPYNVSPNSFKKLAINIGLPQERVYGRNLRSLGHNFCGDGFIAMKMLWTDGSERIGDPFLLCAAGATGTFGAMVLKGLPRAALN